MKALIPAAGLGTRYLPLTKAIPKEMVPVGKFPVLHHVVAEAKAAGCNEIGIILSEGKEAIRKYFSRDDELIQSLEVSGKRYYMAEWEALMDGLTFTWIDQAEQRGLGDAIACGEAFTNGEPFCVLLGDTIMEGGSPLPIMVELHQLTSQSVVAVEPVVPERATRYGVCGGIEQPDGSFELDAMIEKPSIHSLPRMRTRDEGQGTRDDNSADRRPPTANQSFAFAFAARYVFSPSIFSALRTQTAGMNNEIQLTDAMATVMKQEGFQAIRIPGHRRDIGTPETRD